MTTWLLLHGTPLTPAIWDGVRDRLAGTVIAPGLSTVPESPHPQAALAAGVVASLPPADAGADTGADPDADPGADARIDVVGHSFGGQIAVEVALLLGPRLRTLTILCSRDSPFPAFAPVAAAVGAGDPPSVDASLGRWFTAAELADDGDAVQTARHDLQTVSLASWAAALEAIASYDRTRSVGRITAPATLIAAGLDPVSTPLAMTGFAARLPDGHLVIRDDWAHMSPFAHPTELVGLLQAAAARRI